MAGGTLTMYQKNLDRLSINDLLSATVKVALVTSSYTPDVTSTGHDEWSDVSANEIANGNGYTTGGVTLANDTATAISGGFKYDSDDPAWTASGGNIPAWRYAVVYASGSLWGRTSPLIGYCLGDTTPADVPATSSGNTLTLQINANGWFDTTD